MTVMIIHDQVSIISFRIKKNYFLKFDLRSKFMWILLVSWLRCRFNEVNEVSVGQPLNDGSKRLFLASGEVLCYGFRRLGFSWCSMRNFNGDTNKIGHSSKSSSTKKNNKIVDLL